MFPELKKKATSVSVIEKIPIKSLKLEKPILSAEQVSTLSEELQLLYNHIFNAENNYIEMDKILCFPEKKSKLPQCNKRVSDTEPNYRCFDCESGSSSLICTQCFEAGDHRGHRFKKDLNSNPGTCDCGNQKDIKIEGFCKNHSGKLEPAQIPPEQRKRFMECFKTLFSWLLRLQGTNHFEDYGKALVIYLDKLVNQSIYYIELTSDLLIEKVEQSENILLYLMLRFPSGHLVNFLNAFLLKLMVFEKFMEVVIVEAVRAYNQKKEEDNAYEETIFHFQHFENVIEKLLNQDKIVIMKPLRKDYNFEFMGEFLFSQTTFKKEVTLSYFRKYFTEGKVIQPPYLNSIQDSVQKGNEDLLNVISDPKYLNQIIYYFLVFCKVVQNVKQSEEIMKLIGNGLYEKVQSQTFNKNKIVLDYQRCFIIVLFAFFSGNINEVKLEDLAKFLGKSKEDVLEFMRINSKRTLKCILEFAQTFAKNSYFMHYMFYVFINFSFLFIDMLFLRLSACLFANQGLKISDLLLELYQDEEEEEKKKKQPLEKHEWGKKWVIFVGLITETIVSNKIDVLFWNRLQIDSKQLQEQQVQITQSLVSYASPIPAEELEPLMMLFFDKFKQEVVGEMIQIKAGKYVKKEQLKTNQFCQQYYPSMKKLSFTCFEKKSKKQEEPVLYEKNHKIASNMISRQFLEKIGQFLKDNLEQEKNVSLKTIIKDFQDELIKIKIFKEFADVKDILSDIQSFRKESLKEEKKEDSEEKKQLKKAKLEKFKEKQKAYIETHQVAEEEKQVQEQDLCIICHLGGELYHLTTQKKSNLFNLITGEKQQDFCLRGCMHLVHLKCVVNIVGSQCPLCKQIVNFFIPSKETLNKAQWQNLIKNLAVHRMIVKKEGWYYNETIFWYFLRGYCELIGLTSIVNNKTFRTAYHKIANKLFYFLNFIIQTVPDPKQLFLKVQKQIEKPPVKESEEGQIIKNIERCIISTIMLYLKGNPIDSKENYAIYKDKINHQDLITILESLDLVLNKKKQANLQIQADPVSLKVKKVTAIFEPFQSPYLLSQLIQRRGAETKNICHHDAHLIGVCFFCKKGFCLDCGKLQAHAKEVHCHKMLFLNLFDGSIILYMNQPLMLPPSYKNSLGQLWKVDEKDKDPKDYFFDEEGFKSSWIDFLSQSWGL